MKLTTVLLIAACLQVSARGYSQKVTLKENNISLQKIFEEIRKQTGYQFFYADEALATAKNVTVNFNKANIEEVLDFCFKDQQLTYTISENTIIVKKKITVSEINARPTSAPTTIEIKGRVTDDNGQPLEGATILVKGTTNGTKSDANGNFSIEAGPKSTLIISYVGFETTEVEIGNLSTISVKLKPAVVTGEQLVVIGYGSQRKRDLTSAISTVNTKDIGSRPLVSAAEVLTGKAPGVQVVVPSGKPGANLSVRVRGIGSPNGAEPLYVIDGVLVNDINGIDPNNIASISILKDASAAGIYGAAGSTNGVVLITTKQGSRGKRAIDLNIYTGFQQITRKIDVLTTPQWTSLVTEIFGNSPVLPNGYSYETNNDWQDLVYRNAMMTGVNTGFSGGNENGTYYFGLGYLNQDGIVVSNYFKRYSLKLNLEQTMNNWLKVGTHLNYNRTQSRDVPDNSTLGKGGVIMNALLSPPWIPKTITLDSTNSYDPNGYPVYGYNPLKSGDNPYSYIYNNTNKTIGNYLLGDVYAEVKLPFDIKYRTQFGGNMEISDYDYFLDPYNNLYGRSKKGIGRNSNLNRVRWSWDNTLAWTKTIPNHSFNITAGTSAVDEKISQSSQSAENFATNVVQTLNAGTSNKTVYSAKYEWTTNSYFGRLQYAYKDKYLFSGTLRNDRSSRAGVNFSGRTFPAASIGWRLSKEDFMSNVAFVQNIKLRAGYGSTGNLPPYSDLYPSVTPLSQSGKSYVFGDKVEPGVALGQQIGNPDLKWESAKQFNIGFDASFWNERVTLSADYYHKKVTDMIFPTTLSYVLGRTFTVLNLPGYNINKGFEFNIDATLARSKDFEWNANLNTSFNKNFIGGLDSNFTIFTGQVYLGGYSSVIKNGYSLGTFWGYQSKGVDPQTGNIVFSDKPTSLGSALPKFSFGFSNDFRYRNFTLSVLTDGVSGNKVYNATRMELETLNSYDNQSADVLKRWQKPGDISDIPRALGNATTNAANANKNYQVSSRFVEDGSFIRIRNATLAYQFRPDFAKKYLHLTGLRTYISVQNLVTFTKYKGYYPEVNAAGQGTNNNPYNASANSLPSPITLGIDAGTYPQARIFTFGFNVQL